MTHRLIAASVVSALALVVQVGVPSAHAATGLDGWDVKPVSVDEDDAKTHRAIIDTSGDIPDSVALELTATSTEGDDVSVSMTAPHSGSVSTSGSLELQIQPEGGTVTLVILGLGDGSAIGDEFEVVLPLHPETGGEADVVFSEGEGSLSAALTPIPGEVDGYSVELSLDFDITGDVSGLELFDVTVQETDGDVSAIDEQAELDVDSSDIRWRTTFETSATSLGSVSYDGTASFTTGSVTTDAETFVTTISDVDPSDGTDAHFGLIAGTLTVRSVERTSTSGGSHKLVVHQTALLFDEEVPEASFELSSEDGDDVASITASVRRTVSGFVVPDIAFEDSAVGSTLTIVVDMIDADGEVIESDTVDAKVRRVGSYRNNVRVDLDDAHVWGYAAVEQDDGTVGLAFGVGGKLASDIVELEISLSSTDAPDLTDGSTFSAERQTQLIEYRGTAIVDADYDGATLDIAAELTNDDGDSVSTDEASEVAAKPRRRRIMRRAMKTDMNNGPRYY